MLQEILESPNRAPYDTWEVSVSSWGSFISLTQEFKNGYRWKHECKEWAQTEV